MEEAAWQDTSIACNWQYEPPGRVAGVAFFQEFRPTTINAIRTHTTQGFREKYRQIDVLLVDDIQFIAGKESTQEEFFHTFNTLHGQNKQIVVTSDRPPKALVTLEERLCSRFEWGLAADIQPPDFETRQAILRTKAEHMGRVLPNEMLELIARRVQSNIRELEGALTRVMALSDLTGQPMTAQLVETALIDFIATARNEIGQDAIIDEVASEFWGQRRCSVRTTGLDRLLLPRQIAMYLLRQEQYSLLPDWRRLWR